MKVYIRSAGNISPQHSNDPALFFSRRETCSGNRMHAIEPDYGQYVDAKMIRRMSRIVKMGVAAAMECLRSAGQPMPEAIVTGTAYGCLEDTGIFLRRMIDNAEELLTPTAFIQSTHNTVGAQIALLLKCHGYNNTIVHRAFSFENALTDASLLLKEGMGNILVGAIDEITTDSHEILSRFGLYRKGSRDAEPQPEQSKACIAGEGASFFLLDKENAPGTMAELKAVSTIYKPGGAGEVESRVHQLLEESSVNPGEIDLVISGRTGEAFHDAADQHLPDTIFRNKPTFYFKALSGEYPTASGFALWLAATLISRQQAPDWFIPVGLPLKNILIHNHYQNTHHSLFLISVC
jgi:3-oxoacyl-(acyl-carrier-protein) synthase